MTIHTCHSTANRMLRNSISKISTKTVASGLANDTRNNKHREPFGCKTMMTDICLSIPYFLFYRLVAVIKSMRPKSKVELPSIPPWSQSSETRVLSTSQILRTDISENYVGGDVVVAVDDSHTESIVLTTEETTVTRQVSHRPVKCQSRLWSQRGTKVNGSHYGDNPLLRPTGIRIATKRYATLQVMAPTNVKTVHQTSLLHIESDLDRLGLLSPTHDQRSQQQSGQITLQSVLINKSKFLNATHRTKILKIEIPSSMVMEPLSWRSPVHPLNSPTNFARLPPLVVLVEKKMP